MLPPRNKTVRVQPHERSKTRKHYMYMLTTYSQRLETLWDHFGNLGASKTHAKHEEVWWYL